jgi:hypothetical protein
LIAALVLAVSTAGCLRAQGSPGAAYDQMDGPAIAREIEDARLSFVQFVEYTDGTVMDPGTIAVFLADGYADGDLWHLTCRVVNPALRGHRQPKSLGVSYWDDGEIVGSPADFRC